MCTKDILWFACNHCITTYAHDDDCPSKSTAKAECTRTAISESVDYVSSCVVCQNENKYLAGGITRDGVAVNKQGENEDLKQKAWFFRLLDNIVGEEKRASTFR